MEGRDSMMSLFVGVREKSVDLSCIVIVIQCGLCTMSCDLYYVGVSDRNAQLRIHNNINE